MASNPLATAGAVPVKNERGETVMQKVRVNRYVAGQKPIYARNAEDDDDDDDDEEEEDDMFALGNVQKQRSEKGSEDRDIRQRQRKLNADEASDGDAVGRGVALHDDNNPAIKRAVGDSRLRRLGERATSISNDARLQRLREREAAVVEDDSSSDSDEDDDTSRRRRQRMAEIVEESDSSSDDDDGEDGQDRRARLLAIARAKAEDAEPDAGLPETRVQRKGSQTDEESGSSSDDSSSSSSDDDSDEDEDSIAAPLFKPVFVSKQKRLTKLEEEERMKLEEERCEKELQEKEEAKKEFRSVVSSVIQKEMQAEFDEEYGSLLDDDDDNADPEEEYQLWKVRELRRIKRDRGERDAIEREKLEIQRIREMTDEEREKYFQEHERIVTNQSAKGKMKFMQKYYHKGSFFQDKEDEIYKRDFTEATLDDNFNKMVLPKVMQVKNFGKIGRTKYTHLADQDTTDKSSLWGKDKKVSRKMDHKLGRADQDLDRPAYKKKKF